MDPQKPSESITVESAALPPTALAPQPKPRKPIFIVVSILLLVLLIAFGSSIYVLNSRKTEEKNNQTPVEKSIQWKTYTNDFYNFTLEIPDDWKIDEKIIEDKNYQNGRYQEFVLSAPNGELIIDNRSVFSQNNHAKQELPNTKVNLGKYVVDRYPFINDDNERIDSIQLLNIPRHEDVTFAFQGNVESHNDLLLQILKTFAYTKERPSLDEYISYTIPPGWKKVTGDPSYGISFTSPDFRAEGIPSLVSGAALGINKVKRDQSLSVADQSMPKSVYGTWDIATSSATFQHMSFVNQFACAGEFKSCADYYATTHDDDIWIISFSCKDCSTKKATDSTSYAKERDAFLSSITFK